MARQRVRKERLESGTLVENGTEIGRSFAVLLRAMLHGTKVDAEGVSKELNSESPVRPRQSLRDEKFD